MRYLAILRDSIREAIDNKVIYVTGGLSVLVFLFVGSLSFEPAPASEAFGQLFKEGDEMRRAENPRAERDQMTPRFRFRGAEAIKGPADSMDSEYLVTSSLSLPSKELADQYRAQAGKHIDTINEQLEHLK